MSRNQQAALNIAIAVGLKLVVFGALRSVLRSTLKANVEGIAAQVATNRNQVANERGAVVCRNRLHSAA